MFCRDTKASAVWLRPQVSLLLQAPSVDTDSCPTTQGPTNAETAMELKNIVGVNSAKFTARISDCKSSECLTNTANTSNYSNPVVCEWYFFLS